MTLWFVFAMMTAAAVFAVLWPLGRAPGALREGNESTVYKDQLAEIERDVAAGLIGSGEAEAARVEIGRRLLAADDAERKAPASSSLRMRNARKRPLPHSRWTIWWRRSRPISRKIRPTAAAGTCSRRCWQSLAVS